MSFSHRITQSLSNIYVYIGNANGTLKVVVPNLNQIDTSSLYSSNEKISERNLCGIKS